MSVNKQHRSAREQAKPTVLQIVVGDIEDSKYYLTMRDTCVHVTNNTTSTTWTLYLPSVVKAKGEFYSIHVTIGTGGTVLVLELASDSYDWDGSTGYDLDASNDGILLYSDGRTWWEVDNRVS